MAHQLLGTLWPTMPLHECGLHVAGLMLGSFGNYDVPHDMCCGLIPGNPLLHVEMQKLPNCEAFLRQVLRHLRVDFDSQRPPVRVEREGDADPSDLTPALPRPLRLVPGDLHAQRQQPLALELGLIRVTVGVRVRVTVTVRVWVRVRVTVTVRVTVRVRLG